MSPSCTVTSSKDINICVKLRKQRIVGDYHRRFEKKLLVMPDRCVVYGCSNKADPEKGIGLHKIPFFWRRSQGMPQNTEEVDRLCTSQTSLLETNEAFLDLLPTF